MFFVAAIAITKVPQAVDMLKAFKDRVKERNGRSGSEAMQTEARAGPSQKNPRKRAWEGGNTARTYRSPGEMPVPAPSRATINLDSLLIHDFNRPPYNNRRVGGGRPTVTPIGIER